MDASDTENTNDLIIKIKKEEVEEWYYKDKDTGTVGVRKYEKGKFWQLKIGIFSQFMPKYFSLSILIRLLY